jgi:DNA adenine methylase
MGIIVSNLSAPFPWFGGKSKVADRVWRGLGNVSHYVESFFGSGVVLLNRSHESNIETVFEGMGI